MSTDLQKKVLAYLQAHNVMTLATSGPEGLWAAAVFYVNDGFRLYFLSSPDSRHSLNLETQPRIAATIQEDYKDWPEIKGIQLEGEAKRVIVSKQALVVARYGSKFPIIANISKAPAEVLQAFNKITWYQIVPDRLYFIDNSLGLGHRDEVQLD
jgi:uncharacterized protein YhbP (UPF0306 family)